MPFNDRSIVDDLLFIEFDDAPDAPDAAEAGDAPLAAGAA
jgi:hypothetical protein